MRQRGSAEGLGYLTRSRAPMRPADMHFGFWIDKKNPDLLTEDGDKN
jgi:hypothetical protein